MENSLEKVIKLRGVNFDWKDKDKFGNKTQIGFIAQEVENIVPELVDTHNNIKSVNFGLMIYQ